ncbi:MAG: S41 family peptidase, partial [Aquaticitalea sp.]
MKNRLFLLSIVILSQFQYCFSQTTILQPADMKYDLAVMKATWENIHPGLYRFNSKEQIDNYFKVIDKKVDTAISLKHFFILISQLNIKLKCGHSFVSYWNNKNELKEELFSKIVMPVMYNVIDNKFIITYNLTDNKQIKIGDEILAINGIPTKQIVDSLITISKADGKNGLNKKLDNITIHKRDLNPKSYCTFDVFFPLFFKPNIDNENYELTLKAGKRRKIILVKGFSKEQREQNYIAKNGIIPKNEQTWYLNEIDKNTVLFRLGDFTTYNWKFDFKKYLDSTFISINKKGYKNLIVDIRETEGGADEARDAVLSYLVKKPFGCANPVRRLYKYISIPDSLSPYLDGWDDDFKKPKIGFKKTEDGFYEKENVKLDCDEISPNPNRFRGNLYLITDATNSSATFIM